MNRQDFDKWKEDEAPTFANEEFRKYRVNDSITTQLNTGFKAGADAAFNLLSKEISEKDEEIKVLKEQLLATTHHLNRVLEDTEKAFLYGKNGYSWEQFNRLKEINYDKE